MAQNFSQEDIDEFKECFNLHAKSGVITNTSQLSFIMRSLGMAPIASELAQYFKAKGEISFPMFLDVINQHRLTEDAASDILKAFRAMDKHRKGEIAARDLRDILMNSGERMSRKEVDAVFREGNIAPNGAVRYKDFIKYFVEPKPDY